MSLNKLKNKAWILSWYFITTPLLAGIIEPNIIWDKLEVKTCFFTREAQLSKTYLRNTEMIKKYYKFAPKEISKDKKKAIKKIIMSEYTPEKTGIYGLSSDGRF